MTEIIGAVNFRIVHHSIALLVIRPEDVEPLPGSSAVPPPAA
jgi:hypothetical protein